MIADNRRGSHSGGVGVMSIVLIVVVLAMSVMAMLVMLSTRDDASLSRRSAEVTQTVYELYDRAERHYAALDEAVAAALSQEGDQDEALRKNLPEGMALEEDVVSWQEQEDSHVLLCRVRISADGTLTILDNALTTDMGDDEEWS